MELKQQTISGVKWSGFARGSQQIIQFIIAVILARLLMPEDFGILAMAIVFTGLIAVFNDFGIGSAIIQKQDLTENDLSSIFWLNVSIGIVTSLLTVIISPLIAAFYEKEILSQLLSLMALGFFFTSLSTVQQSLLIREMNFKKISMFEITSTVFSGIVAISLAYFGYGVWSLVWQGLTATIVMVLLLWLTSQWRPKFTFHVQSIKSVLGFSLNLLGFSTINYFSRNVDYLLIGKFLGAEPLGYYTLAYRLMLYPLENISAVVSRVLFPAFSTIQNDNARFRDAYLKTTRYIAFVTFPMMFGLFAVTNEFILTIFGPKWEQTIFLLKILCFIGMLQSIGTTVGQIYLAKGKTDWMFKWGLFTTVVTVLFISVGLHWGLKGVAIAYAARILVLSYPGYAIPFKLIGLKVKNLFQNLRTEFVVSLIMFVFVLSSAFLQRRIGIDSEILLVSNVLFGITIYILATRRINSEVFKEIRAMVWKNNTS
jgi:O-antigen/teichoic acid export membrane protein